MIKSITLIIVLTLSLSTGALASDTRAPEGISALGSVNWYMELNPITGGDHHIGVEFDGTHFWVTGIGAANKSHLYEISLDGVLINQYPQPGPAGTWGYRDLAFDGTFLYADAGATNPGYIAQIDPTTGQPTGTLLGPYPIQPCRALAYDTATDTFWTASFSSSIYQCFRDGTYLTYTNPSLAMYGAAMEESHPSAPKLWWWSQDGSGSLASEFDPTSGTFTGKTFSGTLPVGPGFAAGCCAYDLGGGFYELAGVVQLGSEYLAGFDLSTVPVPLSSDYPSIDAVQGGQITFHLNAGPDNANRQFGLFATTSGTAPGTPLPSGIETLRINWDWYTDLILWMAAVSHPFTPFFGQLNASGEADVVMTIPPIEFIGNLDTDLSFCLNTPFDYASNPVGLLIQGL